MIRSQQTVMLCILAACALSACGADDPNAPESFSEDVLADPDLDWELDDELDSAASVCPPDNPDCDSFDEPCSFEEDEGTGTDIPGSELMGLTDPKNDKGKYRVWPNGRIPYAFAQHDGKILLSAQTRNLLSQAMTNWEKLSEGRVRFRAKTSSDEAYVKIAPGGPWVAPFIGYRPGRVQELRLRNSNEYVTVIKHELGHVIGLHHEQKRKDREKHILVDEDNIVDSAKCRHQFSVCWDCPLLGSYDINSVMHYRTTRDKVCRTGPVVRRLDGSSIAHDWKLSVKDLNSVALLYGSGSSMAPSAEPIADNGSLTANGVCADVAGGDSADGAKVLGWGCHGAGNQDWRTTRHRQLKVGHSLKCASVVGPSVAGAPVEQSTCSPSAERQEWKLQSMEIVNGKNGKCLHVPSSGYFSGQTVRLEQCAGAERQKFNYRPDTEEIKAGGFCLTPEGGATSGNDVILRPCDGRLGQRWFQGRGGFVNRANTGQCMRVEGGAERGTRIEVADCNDALGQRWALRGEVRDVRSNLCLQAASSWGTQLELASCSGTGSQQWTFWSR